MIVLPNIDAHQLLVVVAVAGRTCPALGMMLYASPIALRRGGDLQTVRVAAIQNLPGPTTVGVDGRNVGIGLVVFPLRALCRWWYRYQLRFVGVGSIVSGPHHQSGHIDQSNGRRLTAMWT